VTRLALATLGTLLVLGGVVVALARLRGKSTRRGSVIVAIVARWLAAYALWSFAGGLALMYGLLGAYNSPAFAAVTLFGAIVEYRAQVRLGRERGLVIFVGVQLAWLALVLLQNGILTAGW
jgi:hypothetical protein